MENGQLANAKRRGLTLAGSKDLLVLADGRSTAGHMYGCIGTESAYRREPSPPYRTIPLRRLLPMPPPIPNSYILPNPRFTAGEYPGAPYTKSDAQLRARLDLFLSAGICAFIDLTSTTDPLKPYEPTLRSIAQERSIEVSHERLTIPDMGVSDAAHMRRVLDTIDAHLADGRHVYVHCWGGVGRTGTVVGCWLVRHGMTGDEAIDQVRTLFNTMSPKKLADHPEGSPQTEPQRAMVRNWREPGHSPRTESA